MRLSLSIRRLAIILGLSAAWLSLWCAPALAHAKLLQADPDRGDRLSQPPEQVRLQFNEPIEAEFTPLKVFGPQGDRVDRGNARIDPNDARAVIVDLKTLPESSQPRIYTVEWRVTSADGHPVNDTYGFTVVGVGTDASQSTDQADAGAVGVSEEQTSDGAEPGSEGQQDNTGGLLSHALHIVALGLGAVILLVVALLRRIRAKR